MSRHLASVLLAVIAVASFAAFVYTGLWPFVVLQGLALLAYGVEVRRQYG